MNDVILKEVSSHKHLGIFLSNDGTWHVHINYIIDNAWKRVHLLRRLNFVFRQEVLRKIYVSFVRPILEYGDIILDNGPNEK